MSEEAPRPMAGPTVEVPKPTVWPMVLALGITLAAAGVATGPAFVVLGALVLVIGVVGWIGGLLPGRGHTEEPMTAPSPPQSVVGRTGDVEHLLPGMAGYRFRLPLTVHPVSAGVRGAVAGGLAMPLPAFAWALLSGHSIWFPVNLLSGTVLPGVGAMSVAELDQFRLTLLLVGVVIHAVMSLVVGLLYGVLLPTLPRGVSGQMVCGGLVVPLLWTGLSYGLMGVLNPPLREYVDWASFAASQFVFGVVAAAVVVRSERVPVTPAGGGS